MPITRAQFYIYNEQKYIIIDQIEAESSYQISPIQRKTHSGKQKTLGYNYEVNLYVPHNLYWASTLLEELEALNSKELVQLYITIGSGGSYIPPKPTISINYNSQQIIFFHDIKLTIEIESVDYRPRAILRISGFKKSLEQTFFKE